MTRRTRTLSLLMLAPVAAVVAAQNTQEMGRLDTQPGSQSRRRELVRYVPEPQSAVAGRRTLLEVRLEIVDGFHVNSHRPKSDLLIPTTLQLSGSDGVTAGAVDYPPGASYTLAADPSEALDVYTGTVTLHVPVTATAGEHVVEGTLRYQACDGASCFPPRTLAIRVPFTAR